MKKLTGESLNITEKNLTAMREFFPEAFEEGKIDFDVLRQLLGNFVDDKEERYSFKWNGKGKALRLSQTPSLGTLRPCREESKDWDTTENLYIEGDNLEVLKLLQKSYYGKVKMIYIDPPYNTGGDFVYKDDFRDNIENYKRITGQVDGEGHKIDTNTESSGRFHTDWLNMMYPRLRLARNLLSENGVIFISIDDNEQDNLKKICGEVFGEDNFIIQIAWRRTDNQPNIGKIARVKEYIVCYCKSKKNVGLGKLPLTEKAMAEYRYNDSYGKFRRAILLDKTRGCHYYSVKTKSGNILNGPWMKTEEEFRKLDNEGKIYWTTGGDEQPYGKIYLAENLGAIPNDFWGIEYGTNQRGSLELEKLLEGRVFDFPKPISLITTLINFSTERDSISLDFFSGSATTAHAVMQLNAEDGGKRKFIMVQLPEPCNEKSEAYKAGYKNICEIGKERIRRAGEKIKAEAGDKAQNLDIGFKVFKLDSSNLKKWNLQPEDIMSLLQESANNFLPDRSQLDVVYEIMLKMGLDLTLPIEERRANGETVDIIGGGALMICLGEHITLPVAEEIAKLHKEYESELWQVVFRDNGFASDMDKTNIRETLKTAGLDEDSFVCV